MTDVTSSQWTLPTETGSETFLDELLLEIQRLNEQMKQDQTEIDRLKMETRAISAHTDNLLLQIEAQLDALQQAA